MKGQVDKLKQSLYGKFQQHLGDRYLVSSLGGRFCQV